MIKRTHKLALIEANSINPGMLIRVNNKLNVATRQEESLSTPTCTGCHLYILGDEVDYLNAEVFYEGKFYKVVATTNPEYKQPGIPPQVIEDYLYNSLKEVTLEYETKCLHNYKEPCEHSLVLKIKDNHIVVAKQETYTELEVGEMLERAYRLGQQEASMRYQLMLTMGYGG